MAASAWAEAYGPSFVNLEYMAVALACRGADGAVADEMFSETLGQIAGRAAVAGFREVLIRANIFHMNLASQRMAQPCASG